MRLKKVIYVAVILSAMCVSCAKDRTNEYVEKALAELEEEGVDTKGADFAPIEVELQPGGN